MRSHAWGLRSEAVVGPTQWGLQRIVVAALALTNADVTHRDVSKGPVDTDIIVIIYTLFPLKKLNLKNIID